MQISILAVLASVAVATAAAGAAKGPQDAGGQEDARCAASIGEAIATGTIAAVPAACWRIGSLQLGMSETDVAHRIGQPFAETTTISDTLTSHREFHAAVYAIGARRSTRPIGHDARWFMELRFERDRLVAIDTSVDVDTEQSRCSRFRQGRNAVPIGSGKPRGVSAHFGRVKIGDKLAVLGHTFGHAPSGNRPKDWFNYWPIPITFAVDPYRNTISGIAIATDEEVMMDRPPLDVVEQRDPVTCKPVSVRYSLRGPDR